MAKTENCAFIITDKEAETYKSLGNNAIVYAQKLAKDHAVTNTKVTKSRLLEFPRFYRLQVTYEI